MANTNVAKIRSDADVQEHFRGLKEDINNNLTRVRNLRDYCSDQSRADMIGQIGVLETQLQAVNSMSDQLVKQWDTTKVTA